MTKPNNRRRVLIVTPLGRDGPVAQKVLAEHRIGVQLCDDVTHLCAAAREAAGACVIAEEALDAQAAALLIKLVTDQPAWSDLPLVVITNRATLRRSSALETLFATANVTTLERPLRAASLVSTLRSALRARDRQYEAERAIMQRDAFLAMLSHELRNPLAAVMLAADVLRSGIKVDRDRHAQIVARQAAHLSRLVDDLLDVSRVTTGKISLQRQHVALASVIDNALVTLAARHPLDRVDREYSAAPLIVDGDQARLEQVFVNLIGNALKYTPPPGRICVRAASERGEVVVSVRDSGIGIAPDMLANVFDIFVQADGALDRAQGGMGVGLTLARTLVDLHGGRISVASEGLGRGAEFSVRMPLCANATIEPRPGDDCTEESHRSIVIVEDTEDLRDTIVAILDRAGHTIASAHDGLSGLDVIAAQRPDIAIVDLGLPGIDGYELARRVRQRVGVGITLIALSGYGQAEDRARALAAGFDEHHTKPIGRDTLLAIVSSAKRHDALTSSAQPRA